jgi:hypothetical protein
VDFSLPWGLLKKPFDWATKKLFLSAYQASDEYYWQHSGLGVHWRPLGPHLEYDTHLASIFSNEKTPLSYIAIRAKEGAVFKKATVKFAAKGPVVDYQDTIVLYDIGKTPTIKALPSIPLKSLWVARGGVRTPYKDIEIEVIDLYRADGSNVAEGIHFADSFIPTYTELLNSEFVKRWGYWWNVDEINWQKKIVRELIYMKFLFAADRPWRPLSSWHPKRVLFVVLVNAFTLSLVFWSRNLVHGRQIRSAIAKEQRERHQDLVQNNAA